jgi:hypothetical protein
MDGIAEPEKSETQCQIPPLARWRCSREPGHEGPCAARPIERYTDEAQREQMVMGNAVNPSESDTPRTDFQVSITNQGVGYASIVQAEFARDLERDLTRMRAILKQCVESFRVPADQTAAFLAGKAELERSA